MSLKTNQEFLDFYEKQVSKVRGLLYRIVGEVPLNDLTQETFLKAWEYRNKFRGDSEASTWLYRISYNCAIDYLRKTKNRDHISPEQEEESGSLEKEISQRDLADKALAHLEVEHRVVTVLFYLEDQSIKEISRILQIPEGTVKSRLNTARIEMNEFLTKKGVTL